MAAAKSTMTLKAMLKYLRPVWIAAGACLVLLFAGWGIATVYLNSAAFRQLVIRTTNAAISGGIDIADHHVSLLAGRLILHDLQLKDRQNKPVAGCERLQIQLFWPELIRHGIRIAHLGISGLDVALNVDEHGRLNLSEAIAGEAAAEEVSEEERKRSGTPWQVRVDDFRLQNGRVSCYFAAEDRLVQADSIALEGNGNLLKRTFQAQLDVGRISLHSGDIQQVIDQIAIEASHHPGRARPMSLTLRMPGADLQCNGRMDPGPAVPTLDVTFAFDAALDRLNAWLPDVPLLQGRASGRGTARGAIDDPEGTIHLEMRDARVDEIPFDHLTVDLKLDQRRITVSDARSQSAWGRLNLAGWIDLRPMFPESWRQSATGPETLTYELQLSGSDLLPERVPQDIFDWGGKWQANVVASGKGMSVNSATGSATVTLQAESFKPPAASSVETGKAGAQLTWAGPTIEIVSLTAETNSHSLQVDGRIDVADRQIRGAAELDSSRLSDLGALLGIALPAGQGALQLKCQGQWDRPSVQGNLLAQHLEISGWRLGRLLVEAELNPDGLIRFPRLVLENQGSLLEGRGSLMLRGRDDAWLSDPAVEMVASIDNLEPHDFGEVGPWQGRFNGRLKLDGTLKQPLAQLEIADSSVAWRKLSGHLQGAARWQGGRLEISSLKLTSGQSRIQMSGAMHWRDPQRDVWSADPAVTARIVGSAIRLEDLIPGYTGNLTAEAVLSGRMSDLHGTFKFNGKDLDLKHQRLFAVDVGGRLSGQQLYLDEIAFRILPGQALEGAGWYGFDGRYAVTLAGEAIELRHIDALQRVHSMKGRMAVRLHGDGSLEQPNLTAAIEVADPSIDSRQWDDFRIDFSIQDQIFNLEAYLNFLFKAHGRLDSGDFDLLAQFEQSELTPYIALMAGDEWAARMTGNVRASGNWRHLDRIDADAAIESAMLKYRAIPLISTDNFYLRIDDGAVDMSGSGAKIMSDGYLDLSASGHLSSNLSVNADGRVPLAALAPFTDSLADARGDVTLQVEAGGPLSTLQWQADLTLDKIGFAVPALAQTVQNLNGRLTVSPRKIAIESLSGGLDGGRFVLDGRVAMDRYTPTQGEIALQARNLPLQWPGTMDVVVNGDLKLTGASERARLSGNLDLVEGTYYKDVSLNLWSAVSQPRRAESVTVTDGAAAEWMNNVDLAVTVGYRHPFLVDNNLARLQIVPDLKISGTLARPVLNGRAEVTEGEIIFRRKSFVVTTGVVDFINPYKIEPKLDVVSQARIRHWLLSLSVSGTPDRLVFELSSDPPESDNDILSLILFGRTQAEIAGGDTTGSQTTTQMLAALVATTWGESLKKTTGMDILELDTGAADDSEASDRIQVTVGKKLGRRLTIKYAVESTGGEMIQRAISEYRFVEQLLASGYQDSKGDYGGELLFRIEFR